MQVMSPYPISAIQTSSSEFLATYQISLTDYHTPPQENLSNIVVTFTSNLAHQESNLLVSYAVETTPQAACPEVQPEFKKTASLFKEGPTQTPVVNGDSAYPSPEESFFFEANTTYFLAIVVTVIAVCIGCCVICLAVKHSSPKASGGFAAHYPQSPQQAFSPGASPLTASEYQTPHVQRTPLIPGQSGGGSAFKRTGFSPSPQHGLFSQ